MRPLLLILSNVFLDHIVTVKKHGARRPTCQDERYCFKARYFFRFFTTLNITSSSQSGKEICGTAKVFTFQELFGELPEMACTPWKTIKSPPHVWKEATYKATEARREREGFRMVIQHVPAKSPDERWQPTPFSWLVVILLFFPFFFSLRPHLGFDEEHTHKKKKKQTTSNLSSDGMPGELTLHLSNHRLASIFSHLQSQ